MAIHGYPGNIISASSPLYTPGFASGIWNLGSWPRGVTIVQTFTSSGFFTVPVGVTAVDYLVVAGGGAGGGAVGGFSGGGGGGAGGFRVGTAFAVTPGATYSITVGAGGAIGTTSQPNTMGGNGGNSIFSVVTSAGGGGGGGGSNTILVVLALHLLLLLLL